MDDEPVSPFQVVAVPESVKLRLYAAARDAEVTMSELVVSILDEHLPPLPERRT